MSRPLKKKIHINKTVISRNARKDEDEPAITAKTYKQNEYGHEVSVHCPNCATETLRIVTSDGVHRKQLSCGARVWIETLGKVVTYARDRVTGTITDTETLP